MFPMIQIPIQIQIPMILTRMNPSQMIPFPFYL
jgi:hypothetical protein